MARNIVYGILGAIFGAIAGSIVLSTIYPATGSASGPNYAFILYLLIFVLIGVFLGVKFARSLNRTYGNTPLSKDTRTSKIEAFYFIAYLAMPAVLIPLAIILGFVLGGKIPLSVVALCLIATAGFLYHYKHYEAAALRFPKSWWLRQTQYVAVVRVMLYGVPLGTAVILGLYLTQKFGL
jgi:hypothetical protein